MSESNAPAEGPQGHVDSVRLLSVFANVGGGGSSSASAAPAPKAGGVCGSGCGCHH